jgi:isopenicillin-N epimerase
MPFVCRYNLGMPNLKQYFLLDDDVIFLNHGSFGACPRPVFQVYQSWQARLERQPVLFMGREYSDLLREARTALAGYLHTLPGNLVYIPNATFGVNIIARSLSFQPGDEVLTTNHEYGACDNTWEFIARKTGVVIKRQSVPLPVSDAQHIVAQIWQGVTPRTKLIYLSHISSPTGLRLPVEALCNMARLAGIMTLIDGAHAPGQISLNLDTLGADFYRQLPQVDAGSQRCCLSIRQTRNAGIGGAAGGQLGLPHLTRVEQRFIAGGPAGVDGYA